MRNFSTYIFDLDGTLTDSKVGIVNCIKFALRSIGIEETDEQKLNSFIGPTIRLSMSTHYGLGEKDIQKVIQKYRECYTKKGIHQLELYPKAKETLEVLKADGKTICLATSKPKVFALQITKSTRIDVFFDYQEGADLEGKFYEKKDIISSCISTLKLDKKSTLMVGDRLYDIIGAKYVGIKSAGVLCGYGGKDELVAAGADYIINDISQILNT